MTNESTIQAKTRLAASRRGWSVFRNNVGVLKDMRGVPVRFGLANDTKQMNEQFKSADLIGIRPVLITQEMVGTFIGQFVSIECKATDGETKQGQLNWQDMINRNGGYAIITNTGEL